MTLLADPTEWEKWRDLATRGLVPTMAAAAKLFDVLKLMMELQNGLLVWGSADYTAIALHEKVSELLAALTDVFAEATRTRTGRCTCWGRMLPRRFSPASRCSPRFCRRCN